MTEAEKNEQREQLLIAFLDGELGPEDCAMAESLIRDNPEYAQLLQHWRANANAIRELPRFRLEEGFSTRVLALTENIDSHSDVGIHPVSASVLTGEVHAETTHGRIGLAAIATLAAMLLLTLFVFPAVVSPTVDGPAVAINHLDKKVVVEPDTKPLATKSAIETNVVEAVDAASNNDSTNERVGGIARGEFSGVPLKSSLRGGHKSEPVEPIEFSGLAGRPAGVEQVLWIDSNSQQVIVDIEKVLSHHSIDMVRSGSIDSSQFDLTPGAGLKALFVVSTAAKMKQAINEWSADSSHSVKAFPIPGFVLSDQQANSAIQGASVRQIKPLDLSNQDADAGEIARLDKWFGLAAEEDETKLIQFLIFVSISPEQGPASNQ